MLNLALAFLSKYLPYIRYGALALSYIAVAWLVHHLDVMADKAAKADHVENIAQSIPEIITKTQTITKYIHEAKDACTNATIPLAVLGELHNDKR